MISLFDSSFYTVSNALAEIERDLNRDLKNVTQTGAKETMFINKIKTKSMLLRG